jgi:hypothetical protein
MDRFIAPSSPTREDLRRERMADEAAGQLAAIEHAKVILQIAITKGVREIQTRLGLEGAGLIGELEETFLAEKSPFNDIIGDLWHAEIQKLKSISRE